MYNTELVQSSQNMMLSSSEGTCAWLILFLASKQAQYNMEVGTFVLMLLFDIVL